MTSADRMFLLFCKAFNGIATVGEFSASDGHLTVTVETAEEGQLPALDRVNLAHEVSEEIEERLGITVSIRVSTSIAMRALESA